MAEPFHLEILRKLQTRLKDISGLEDGVDEHGRPQEHVFRGRDLFGENDALPILAVLEDPSEPPQLDHKASFTKNKHDFRLIIQGFVADNEDHNNDAAYYLSAKVVEKLAEIKSEKNGMYTNILGFGHKMPCVSDMSIGIPVVRPADNEVSSTAFFYVSVNLSVTQDAAQPYV